MDASGAITGGISGASTGAMYGGPYGAAFGALAGAAIGGLTGGSGNFQADPYTQQLTNLSRSQWEQSSNFLNSTQNRLIQYAENPNYIPQQREQAAQDVNTAYNNSSAGLTRTLSGMGVDPTAEQSGAIAKSTALSKGLASAAAGNQATQQGYATQMGVLTGGQ